MVVYHYDRCGALNTGDTLTLDSSDETDAEEFEFRRFLFPEGLSDHGKHYLGDTVIQFPVVMPQGLIGVGNLSAGLDDLASGMCEWVFESVRRYAFPQHPSRFQSMFCLPSEDDLTLWPELTSGEAQNAQLFEVSVSENLMPFDSTFLRGGLAYRLTQAAQSTYRIGFLPLATWSLAHRYWSGHLSDRPRMEYLVPLPVQVGRKVPFAPPQIVDPLTRTEF